MIRFSESSNELLKRTELNLKLADRNRQLSEFLVTDATGGNSFAIIRPVDISKYMTFIINEFTLKIVNVGHVSMKNVFVEVQDATARNICEKKIDSLYKFEKKESLKKIDSLKVDCLKSSVNNYRICDLSLSKGVKKLEMNTASYETEALVNARGIEFNTVKLSKNQKNLSLRITLNSNSGRIVQFLDILNLHQQGSQM